MYFLVSVLVIILFFLLIVSLWIYNQLILLQVNKDNALADMKTHLDICIAHLDTKKYKKIATARNKAETPVDKVQAFNLLEKHIEDIVMNEPGGHLAKTATQRRYYNHTTKKLNALLATFPSNLIGHMLGYAQEPLFLLTETEKDGETPEVKR